MQHINSTLKKINKLRSLERLEQKMDYIEYINDETNEFYAFLYFLRSLVSPRYSTAKDLAADWASGGFNGLSGAGEKLLWKVNRGKVYVGVGEVSLCNVFPGIIEFSIGSIDNFGMGDINSMSSSYPFVCNPAKTSDPEDVRLAWKLVGNAVEVFSTTNPQAQIYTLSVTEAASRCPGPGAYPSGEFIKTREDLLDYATKHETFFAWPLAPIRLCSRRGILVSYSVSWFKVMVTGIERDGVTYNIEDSDGVPGVVSGAGNELVIGSVIRVYKDRRGAVRLYDRR